MCENLDSGACVYVFGYPSLSRLWVIVITFIYLRHSCKKLSRSLPIFSFFGFLPDNFYASKNVYDLY
jgi:hypothetical protein